MGPKMERGVHVGWSFRFALCRWPIICFVVSSRETAFGCSTTSRMAVAKCIFARFVRGSPLLRNSHVLVSTF